MKNKNFEGKFKLRKSHFKVRKQRDIFPLLNLSKMLCIWFVSAPVPSSWHLVLRAFPHMGQSVKLYRKTAKGFKILKNTFLRVFNKNIGWTVVTGCRLAHPNTLISERFCLTDPSLYPFMPYFFLPSCFALTH